MSETLYMKFPHKTPERGGGGGGERERGREGGSCCPKQFGSYSNTRSSAVVIHVTLSRLVSLQPRGPRLSASNRESGGHSNTHGDQVITGRVETGTRW